MHTSTSPDGRPTGVGVHLHDVASMPAGADRDAIDAIRFLAADAVERAGSGHPGTAMALAPLAYRLFTRHLRHDPADPGWHDRDRFVLSAGHACLLQYAALHLAGYDLSLNDLRAYRRLGSRTPGHPERGRTHGVEVTTGPLGQGIGNAVGMALAERMLAARYNRPGHDIICHRTWAIAGDGDLMEGVSSEAASLAGSLGLDKLTVFYDDNHITIEGSTDLAFREDVGGRFRAYGWHVTDVGDVNDLDSIDRAVAAAVAEAGRPTLVIVRSHIGYGSPKQDSAAAHGAPLGADAVAATRRQLGWHHAPFEIPDGVYTHWRTQVAERAAVHAAWLDAWHAYHDAHPGLADELSCVLAGTLPAGWQRAAAWRDHTDEDIATRTASGVILGQLATRMPELVGGSADLAPSTRTAIHDGGDIAAGRWAGRNLHFGVREHAMGAILNGMAAHGGFRVYGSTFLTFSDYQRPAIRLAALMRLQVVFVFSHDSIGLGEDGPTHQPVEQLASLRAIPGLTVIRPADANETALAWEAALAEDGPTALILSRQALPVLDAGPLDVAGAVVADGSDATIVASGSEVALALAARQLLAARKVAARVVSMPSWELFRRRPALERSALLPSDVPTVAVEAGSPQGWSEFADATVGLDRFGVSAPGTDAYAYLGITAGAVTDRVLELLGRGGGSDVVPVHADDLVPVLPDAVGVDVRDPDSARLEGAHLLANEARPRLRARGFTDEQIREWAEAFIVDRRSGDVEDLYGWIGDRERGGVPLPASRRRGA